MGTSVLKQTDPRDGSPGKPSAKPDDHDFDPRDLDNERREMTPASFPPTNTHKRTCTHTCACMQVSVIYTKN